MYIRVLNTSRPKKSFKRQRRACPCRSSETQRSPLVPCPGKIFEGPICWDYRHPRPVGGLLHLSSRCCHPSMPRSKTSRCIAFSCHRNPPVVGARRRRRMRRPRVSGERRREGRRRVQPDFVDRKKGTTPSAEKLRMLNRIRKGRRRRVL